MADQPGQMSQQIHSINACHASGELIRYPASSLFLLNAASESGEASIDSGPDQDRFRCSPFHLIYIPTPTNGSCRLQLELYLATSMVALYYVRISL